MQKHIFNIVCSEDTLGNDYKYRRVKLEDQSNREKIIKLHGPYLGSYDLSIVNYTMLFNLWIEKEKYNLNEDNFYHNFKDGELYEEKFIPVQDVRMKVILNDVCEYKLAISIMNSSWIALPKTSLFATNLDLRKYYNKQLYFRRGEKSWRDNNDLYYIIEVMHSNIKIFELSPFSFPICNRGKAQFHSASDASIDVQDKRIVIENSPENELSIYLIDKNGERVNYIKEYEVNLIDYLNASLKAVLLENSNIREVFPELEIDDDLDIDKRQLKCLLDKILMQNERILVNNPNLQEGIAKKLRENSGNIKGPKGDQGLKGDMGPKGEQGPRGFNGTQGITGNPGHKGDQGLKGDIGPKGDQGPRGFNGTQGITGSPGQKGDQGLKGDMGPKGDQGPRGFNGTQGITGSPGQKGDQGLKGDMGPKGDRGDQGLKGDIGPKGEQGPRGFNGTQGITGNPGDKGDQGLKGDIGPKGEQGPRGFNGTQGITGSPGQRGDQGLKGDIGPKGPKGEDGISAAVTDQFFSEVNQTKNELRNTQKEIEKSRNASESFAKEAQKARDETTGLHDKVANLTQKAETSSKDAKKFATQALSLQKSTQTFYHNTKDMFCGIKPTDSVCTAHRRKRETRNASNQPVTSGAGRPTSFISQIINFFYPSIKQDKYKIENNIHELNQVVRIVNAANVVLKFEKVLEGAASRCGIPKKHLNLDPTELQSAIVSRSLLDDENRNEMLKFLCEAAKKSCPNYKQADKFLALFKENMKRTLINNEQQRGCVSIEETATDNMQPRSFMSNIIPPTSLSSINQMAVGYLR